MKKTLLFVIFVFNFAVKFSGSGLDLMMGESLNAQIYASETVELTNGVVYHYEFKELNVYVQEEWITQKIPISQVQVPPALELGDPSLIVTPVIKLEQLPVPVLNLPDNHITYSASNETQNSATSCSYSFYSYSDIDNALEAYGVVNYFVTPDGTIKTQVVTQYDNGLMDVTNITKAKDSGVQANQFTYAVSYGQQIQPTYKYPENSVDCKAESIEISNKISCMSELSNNPEVQKAMFAISVYAKIASYEVGVTFNKVDGVVTPYEPPRSEPCSLTDKYIQFPPDRVTNKITMTYDLTSVFGVHAHTNNPLYIKSMSWEDICGVGRLNKRINCDNLGEFIGDMAYASDRSATFCYIKDKNLFHEFYERNLNGHVNVNGSLEITSPLYDEYMVIYNNLRSQKFSKDDAILYSIATLLNREGTGCCFNYKSGTSNDFSAISTKVYEVAIPGSESNVNKTIIMFKPQICR